MFFNKNNSKLSYSHYGEDMILNHIFGERKTGFYADVGCYHPKWFSNTKKLYDKGWRGINIDPNMTYLPRKQFNYL